LVISGTRDEGVEQTAEAFTNPTKLLDFARQANVTQPVEALIEVSALGGVNLDGKILAQSTRDFSVAK
jgi:hypothetical protein